MSAKPISRKAVPALAIAMALLAASLAWCVPKAYAGDAPATQYVDRHWENGQVVSEAKTQSDVAFMTDGHLEWHDGWWYTRDLPELVISDRVSVDDGATANLILMDGKTIKFENGIHVGPGSTLNIYGQAQGTGKLVVGRSEADTAAIGGNEGESNGTINIYGGTIEVTGGSHSSNGGAGIGAGGSASNESSINVYGGTVTSTGGANAAGIGGGARGGHGGEISIYGGYVTANGDSGAAGIGGGEGGSGTGIFIHGGEVHANGGSSSADGGAGIGSGSKGGREGVVGGNVYVFGGSVYATGGADAAGIGGGNEVSGGYVEINGVNGDGAYVEASSKTLGAGIGGGQNGDGGTVEIRKGTVKATGGSDAAGIGGGKSGAGGTITIAGGSVEATGGSYASGIGGGESGAGGTINISGGTITATSVSDGAGIGGGDSGAGGTINISGGTVEATGGANGAGIGGGDCGGGGTITITGGDKIKATGGANGAGIGGGNDAVWTMIEIAGGNVEAQGGDYAAGIGSGDRDSLTTGGAIIIKGGDVTATGGDDGAGIGGGEDCTGGTITISGGTVTATGGTNVDASPDSGGAGIGGGDGADGGTITITGDAHIKKATGGIRSAAIGGGAGAPGGTINISGGLITEAQGGYRAAGIGGGYRESGGTITISGGTIIKTVGGGNHLGIYYYPGGAGIGGGYEGNGGAITISGGDINAIGSPYSAGIGGGYNSESGTILITGGEVHGNGGFPSGAGIGSGAQCDEKDKTTVDITINGGEIHGYAGGRYQYKPPSEDTTYWPQEGAAIGAGGNEKQQEYLGGTAGYGKIEIGEDSFFNGKIVFNGGTVTTGGPLGASVDTCLNEDSVKGEIEFNGATVTVSQADTDSFLEGNYLVHADNITIKEDDSLHQRVSYQESRWRDDTVVVASGDRIDTLKRVNTFSVKVEPCPHEGGDFVDKGESGHSCSCPYCGFSGEEPHAYGEPEWTWGEDHRSATATFTCGDCEHVETVGADIEARSTGNKTTTTATATIDGKVYTATVISYTVTFKVVNGSWDEGEGDAATAAKYVSLCVPEGTEAKLAAEQIPTAGTKPAAGCKAGAWDVEPNTDTAITENTTYTYRYAEKESITPSVTIEGWSYGEDPNEPVLGEGSNPGSGAVTFEYKAKDAADETYSADAPTAPGDYTVRASIAETADYLAGSATADFEIAKAPSPVRVAENATVKAGHTIDLAGYVKMNGAEVDVAFSKEDTGDGCSISGSEFTAGADAVPEGEEKATVEVKVTVAGDANHEGLEATITVTVTPKIVLTINAEDVETTFSEGGTVTIEATVTGDDPDKPYGEISFATDPPVDNEYLESDENMSSTLKILKAGTTYVVVGAGGNDDYAAVYKDVKVTIRKADIAPAVSIEGWTYGEAANEPALAEGSNPGGGEVTFEYKAKGADDSAYADEAPAAAGDYTVRATVAESTNYNGGQGTADFSIAKAQVDAPEIASKPYTGEKQAADVLESNLYDVTENNGGTDVGEYDVALTLKDTDNYKWADSEEAAKTLKFSITKAENRASVTLEGWASNEDPNDPVVEADFGADTATFEYKAQDADDGAYSSSKPTRPGDYTVRANIAGTANYQPASAAADFAVGDPVMVKLTLVGSSIDGGIGEPYVLDVPKGSTVKDLADPDDEAAYDALLARFTSGAYAPYSGVFYVNSRPLTEFDAWYAVVDEDEALYDKALDEDTEFYVPLWKAIDKVELSVGAPACGTGMASAKPAVTVPEGSAFEMDRWSPVWWDSESGDEVEEGTVEGGASYGVRVDLDADFGYCFGEGDGAPDVTVAGADEGSAKFLPVETMGRVDFSVTAVHDWGAWTQTKAPTCSEAGAEERTCAHDASHKEMREVSIDPDAHVWGEPAYTWEGTSKVTAERACTACGEKATETAAVATKVTKATFAAAGKIALTAAFKDPAFEAQTKSTAIPKLTVSGVADRAYTGKAVTQAPVVKSGSKVLKLGTDYTLSYKNNVKPGTATVTVTAKGETYGGSKAVPFAIRSWKRLAGPTAFDTMEQITKEFGKAGVAVVTTNALASASNDAGYKDALAAAALAGGFNAPMLTTSKGGLADKTRSELKRMGVKKVYVVGSTREVASKVDSQIRAMGITVVRVAGTPAAATASGKAVTSTAGGASTATASERAVACAKLVKGRSDTVIIATQNSFKDALAISSYAYATKSPILYAEAGKAPKLSKATLDYIKSAKFGKAIVVGGPVALPKDVETQLKSAGIAANSITRLAGSNQYKTARVIAEWACGKLKNGTGGGAGLYQYASVKFQPAVKLTADRLGVARADDNNIGWKDALAGAALCGRNKSVVLLADAANDGHAAAFVKASKAQIAYGYVFGGTLAVPKATMDKLVQASL